MPNKKPKKVVIKTTQNSASVNEYLNNVEPIEARRDAKILARIFKKASETKPKMWGSSIVGYGQYTYYRANGDEGEMPATAFSMRKSGPVLYIMSDDRNFASILKTLGPHKRGKSCLYLKKLSNNNIEAIESLIHYGLASLKKSHNVVL